MATVDQWIKDIPVITRTYLIGALLTTSACALDLISPFSLYFSARLVFLKYQFWRIITNFLFFSGQFSLDFLFHMFFLARYSRSLEEGSFRGRTADFFYMILVSGVLMLIVSPFVGLPFLGASLTFVMVYVWARRNPYARMNFLGLWTFTAPYLPWVLLGFAVLLGGNGMVDILGIAVGHLYYFLEDVYPRMVPAKTRLLKTPRVIELLFADSDDHPEPAPVPVGGNGDANDDGDNFNFVLPEEAAPVAGAEDPAPAPAAGAAAAVGTEPAERKQAPPAQELRERRPQEYAAVGGVALD